MAPVAVVAPTNWMLHRLQERLVQGQNTDSCLQQTSGPDRGQPETGFMNITFMNFFVLAQEICRRSGADTGRVIHQPAVYEYLISALLKQYLPGKGIVPSCSPPYEGAGEGSIKNALKNDFSAEGHKAIFNAFLKNAQSLPALAKALFQVVQDLIDANVQTDVLQEAVREGCVEGMELQKLHGVTHLFDTFRQRLKTLNISHYSDVYRIATGCVPDSAFLKGFQHILAYGFYDLTGVEQDFFGEIFRGYPTILFLPYQKKHPAFVYGKPFYESFVLGLARDVEELTIDNSNGFSCLLDPKSEHDSVTGGELQVEGHKFSTHLTTYNLHPETRNPKPVIINASGKHDEIWTVAKEILKLTDEGYPMETIGVVARSPEPYADTVKKIFQENSIPFTTSAREPLERYPLIKAIQRILLLKREDFYRPMVIELIGSPYFKIPLCEPKGIIPRPDLWDILSRRLGIRAGIVCWLARLEQAKGMSLESVDLDNEKPPLGEDTNIEEDTVPNPPPYEEGAWGGKNTFPDDEESVRHIHIPTGQIEFLKNILLTVSNDVSLLPEKASWTTMATETIRFLQDYIQIPSEGINPEDTERDRLMLDKVRELLYTLCALDCTKEEVTLDQFIDTFIDACRQETLPMGLENGRGVRILDAMSARGIPFRVLFVLGLNEKVFPRAISEEPFLRDHVRRRLSEVLGNVISEKLRGFDEERLLFSFLLNAARERLYLLYERSDEAGKPKVKSHYLMDILQTIQGMSSLTKGPGERLFCEIYVPRGIKEKLCKQETSLLTPKEAGIRMALDRIDPTRFLKTFGINRDAFARAQSALGSIESYNQHLTLYDGIVGDMSAWWKKQACRGLSPTALETLGTCPFKFFMSKILELESLEEPETAEMIAAVDLGTLYHGILRDFYYTLLEKGYFITKAPEINSPAQNRIDQETPPSSPPRKGRETAGEGKTHDGEKTFLPSNPVKLLHDIAQRYFTGIEQQIPIPYPVIWEIEKEEILALLTRFITWDLEHIGKTGYIPAYLEKTVKLRLQNNVIPEGVQPEEAAKMVLKGKIDRIDMKKEGSAVNFRVIDYKSGRFFKENLLRSAIRGQKLQLPFYIIMAEHLLSEAIKKGRIPQGQTKMDEAFFVYVAEHAEDKTGQVSPQIKTIDSNDWMEYREQNWETLREFLRIIREGIFPVSPAEDTQKCEWCEFATTCRRGHQPLRFRLEQDARLKKYREIVNLSIRKKSGKPT